MDQAGHREELMSRLEAVRIRLVSSSAEGEPADTPENKQHQGPVGPSEYDETLALIHTAADAYMANAERTREAEAKLHELGQSASAAIERLEQQVQELQHRLVDSEERRASAEDGLSRLCAAIREHFSGPPAATNEASTEGPQERLSVAS